MLNYGGSITSAFPNTFCHSPASLTCQLCNTVIKEAGSGSFSFIYSTTPGQPFQLPNRSEKCVHCGINICEKCLNDNHETNNSPTDVNSTEERLSSHSSKTLLINNSGQHHSQHLTQSQLHYSIVKKEFKQMYNYSKEIVEKLHLLNNAIKMEESAVSELNSIKHLVNTKAIELIKQINQEKVELVEQIENAKLKYESTLNDRKEYYALSMQYKDELRKVIRKYKEYKTDEQCSLNEMLKMYLSVKSISKNLDDYDHIKLITEQDPLQVKFEERPTYRNLIGKLLLNKDSVEMLNFDEQIRDSTENLSKEIIQVLSSQLKSSSQNKLIDNDSKPSRSSRLKTEMPLSSKSKSSINKSIENIHSASSNHHQTSIMKPLKKDSSRSVSLNDLLNVDETEPCSVRMDSFMNHHLNMIKCGSDASKNTKRHPMQPICNQKSNNCKELISKSTNNLLTSLKEEKKKSATKNRTQFCMPYKGPPPPSMCANSLLFRQFPALPQFNPNKPPQQPPQQQQQQSQQQSQQQPHQQSQQQPHSQPQSQTQQLQSILKNSETNNSISSVSSLSATSIPGGTIGELILKRMDQYKCKRMPKERLEIDILPSYLSFSQNKLLIASHHGRIRVIDLFSYKIQKDELKNILINGICIPKYMSEEMFYTVANAEMNDPRDDPLSVSNSVVIVTKNELRVLKKKDPADNDNYLFSNPSGICYDDFGNLYICDTGNNRVKILDRNLLLRCVIDSVSNRDDLLSGPKSVACFQNVLFVCDSGKHRIVVYYIMYNGEEYRFKNTIGYGYGAEPGMLRFPGDVCVDELGIVCVRDVQNNRVQMFGIDARPFHFIEVNTEKEVIYSMTVASNGDIYVAKMVSFKETDSNGQINTINKYFIDIY